MVIGPLGRREPTDLDHVQGHPLSAVGPTTIEAVERTLALPKWHWRHNQGVEGTCVGHGWAMVMAILNSRRYDPVELYKAAQLIDEYEDTPPAEGTSVRAGGDVLRCRGPVSIRGGAPRPNEGLAANRWAQSVDELRACIAGGTPSAIGMRWYEAYDAPEQRGKEFWVPAAGTSRVRGGHCVCIYGASDRRQAFRVKNSWGHSYPLVWLPYSEVDRALAEGAELAVPTDR